MKVVSLELLEKKVFHHLSERTVGAIRKCSFEVLSPDEVKRAKKQEEKSEKKITNPKQDGEQRSLYPIMKKESKV